MDDLVGLLCSLGVVVKIEAGEVVAEREGLRLVLGDVDLLEAHTFADLTIGSLCVDKSQRKQKDDKILHVSNYLYRAESHTYKHSQTPDL